jgi:Pentapeptide repeats (8 copies)/Pentapeptide repeats (9 copies)
LIAHAPRTRPANWRVLRSHIKRGWIVPFIAFEWTWQWVAYLLSIWSFLVVLDYLGSFSVLVAVIFYFSASGDRVKQRHYQAWQVINTAQGKGGSGGRIEALQELNRDKVPLVGVDVSSAFLQGLKLERANLLRSNFSAADVRGSDLQSADFTSADLHDANFRNSNLAGASFENTDLHDVDLWGSNLTGAHFSDADLTNADLRFANLSKSDWKEIKSIRMANVAGVKNAPDGFIEWALKNGAVHSPSEDN